VSDGPKYNVKCKLSGTDGNVFALMGRIKDALRKAKAPQADITAFCNECFNYESYDHALQTMMKWVEVC
jgi:hypothetical protein